MNYSRTTIQPGISIRHHAQRMRRLVTTALLATVVGGGVTSASAHVLEEPVTPVASEAEAAQSLARLLAHLPMATDLPAGLERISPHIPGMGEHWADPRALPLGPIYCVMEGRVTCMEFMIAQQDLQSGQGFERFQPWVVDGVAQPPVDHIDLDFMPQGHAGFEVPHYDVHMYFVPAEILEQDRAVRQAAN